MFLLEFLEGKQDTNLQINDNGSNESFLLDTNVIKLRNIFSHGMNMLGSFPECVWPQ